MLLVACTLIAYPDARDDAKVVLVKMPAQLTSKKIAMESTRATIGIRGFLHDAP